MSRNLNTQKIATAAFAAMMIATADATRPVASSPAPSFAWEQGLRSGDADSMPAPKSAIDAAKALAIDAYIYGYPLVTMEMTRRVMTNVEQPDGVRAPMGQLVRMRRFASAELRDTTAPNADMLYTTAFLDVGKEPWILSVPDAGGRYYLMQMLDGWTNVFQAPGSRTTGSSPQTYAITGPAWRGTLPAGVTEYRSATAIVWLVGRIYCSGTPEDYAAVHKMQDDMSLVPLSAYGRPYTPPAGTVDSGIDMKTPVRDQVNGLSAAAYLDLFLRLLKDNPPAAADAPFLAKFEPFGVVPGKKFDIHKYPREVVAALQDVPTLGLRKMMGWGLHSVAAGINKSVHGWLFSTTTGMYGINYLQRAVIAAIGLGANRPEDAVFLTSMADASGEPYVGTSKYVLHFDKGELPPVSGFWSLTMYDSNYFFVDNSLNRYTLSQRDTLHENADGSVDVYLQHDNPGPAKAANWLPTPEGRFNLMLRLYWPKKTSPSILDGTWTVPAVIRAD